MARMKYLVKKAGSPNWQVRMTVPPHARKGVGLLMGKSKPVSVLKRSTGTANLKEAERLAPPIISEFQSIMARANGYWITNSIDEAVEFVYGMGSVLNTGFTSQDHFLTLFNAYTKRRGITGADRDVLLARVLEDGSLWNEPRKGGERSPLKGELAGFAPGYQAPAPQASDVLTLSGLRDQQVQARPMDRKLESEFRRAFAILQRITGDVDIRTITRAHMLEYRDTLQNYPTHNRQADKLSPKEIRETKWARTWNPASINKYLSFVRTAFTHAINDGKLEQNPLDNVMVLAKPTTALYVDRREFELEELQSVMNGLEPDGADYWLPWVGLYTAARLGEITALTRNDLKQDHGVWYFRITDQGEDKSVKTERSVRDVPVHAHLIELGFITYATKQKGRLFPEGRDGKALAEAFSKRFGRYLGRLGLTDPGLTYHSLRHTWITAARFANLPDTIWKQLSAHQDQQDVGDKYGSNRRRMEILRDYINRIRWDGITPKPKRKAKR